MSTTMTAPKSIVRTLSLFLLMNVIAAGCSSIPVMPTLTPSPTFTATASPVPAISPTLTPSPDTGWQLLRPGLERRSINLYKDQNQQVESLYMLRLDLQRFRLDVAYHETPQNLENWQKETNALIVVNGGYFRIENEKYIPNGLTIVGGGAFGSSYESFAGMLAINDYGAELRWLANKPYNPNEPLRAALQSFPVLVKPGGMPGFPEQYEDNIKARRTIIGQDRNGRILLMIAPRGYFTLHQLSVYLLEQDLQLDIAINLDGGPSSGIFLADPRETISSQTLLPIVILAYPR